MIVLWQHRELFRFLKDEDVKRCWFDRLERKFIDESGMTVKCASDDDSGKTDLSRYIRLPAVTYREAAHSLLEKARRLDLYERFNELRTEDDWTLLRTYRDDFGYWLHDAVPLYFDIYPAALAL